MNKIGNVTATIVLQHKDKKDATIAKATIEITKATPETLTFQKVTKVFSRGDSFSTADILAGVQGTKAGYTVKSITNLNPTNLVTVSGTKSLNFSGGVGSFTATIVLEHPIKADATISGAQFEITKATTQRLTFQKVTKVFSRGGSFSTADILAGVQGTKAGYTVKNITAINPNNLVTVSSKALNFKRSVGSFTATIVFEHNTKADATISGAQFEITKTAAERLAFTKQAKPFASGGSFSTAEILAGVRGTKADYTVKSITNLNPTNLATVSSKALNFRSSVGSFTATIVLEHNTKADATISGAQFEITKATAPTLNWTKQAKAFASGGEISNTNLLTGLTGSGKSGYAIKSVAITDASGTGARVSGAGTSAKITSYTKAGALTLTIVFEHNTKADATISGAQFEITKTAAERLTFNKQAKPFASGGSFSTAEILAGVRGTKAGYTVKSITNISPNSLATVSSKALNFKGSVGSFTATIVLEHNTKADATISGAQFEITKATAPTLTWTKQAKAFASGGEISNANLLTGLTGSGKSGYAIKSVAITDASGTGARVSGTGTSAKITSYTKAGALTLTIVFEHNTKADATISGAQFEITKTAAERLAFTKQAKPFSSGGSFSTAEILAGVRGTKAGYTVKSITNLNPTNLATVSSKALNFRSSVGSFTAMIVLEHNTKADATISGAQFEITKANAPTLNWTKQAKAFASGGEISNTNLLTGLTGSGKSGYAIKSVAITDASGTGARVSGAGTSAKITSYTKAGALTLTIVFEHNTKADATISGAQFEITKTAAERLTFNKQAKPFASGGSFSTAEILAGVRGTKAGYTVKSITNISPNSLATVSSKALNFKGSVGSFTATIVLEHNTKADATISGAQFEITKANAPTLTWTKQAKAFASGGEISNANLLTGLTGSGKSGYAIKSVAITDASGTGARVSGTGTSAKITSYTKAGALTLTIVFEHNTKADATISGAQFEITKTAEERLAFTKQAKPFASGGSFSTAEILAGVRGTKADYTVKSITNLNPTNLATVSSKALNFRSSVGSFTATIVLEHNTKADATISGAQFEITKATAPTLNWTKQAKAFASGGEISNTNLLTGLTGSGKSGYAIKSVAITDASGTGARVSGAGTSAKITSYTKAGALTLTIVFEHNTKADATISGAQFEITKTAAERLTFNKQAKPFASGGSFSTAEILAGVRGTKAGYTVKSITNISPNSLATVSSKALNFKGSVGSFTATIVLEHNTKADATISGAQFEITKATAPTLTWTKQAKAFASGGEISNANLLTGLTGSGKSGYAIKSVAITDASGTGARVSGTGTSAKITSYTKAGALTLTIVFEHNTKADATISGAQFEITKTAAERLAFTKQAKPFSSGGSFSTAEILAGVRGTKAGYTVKSITNLNPTNLATVSSKALNFRSSVGSFTAMIVLEHNTKADATISGAQFEITKANAPTLNWTKQAKAFASGGEISNTNLLTGLTGSGKSGYAIKSVAITDASGTGARVSGAGTSAKITSYTKAGALTLTIVFEHNTKADATISGAQFEITKTAAERLTFNKQAKPFASGGSFFYG